MNTFKLPVSPSHVFTAGGLAIVKFMPHVTPDVKAYVCGGIVAAYVIGESIYSSLKSKKLVLPDEIAAKLEKGEI